MLLLFETPAGYSLFKVKAEKKLQDAEVRTTRGDDASTRRDATRRERVRKGARDRRERRWDARRARGRRSTTRDARRARGATVVDAGRREGGRAGGRARTKGRESIREGIGELGIGWRGRRDARTRD